MKGATEHITLDTFVSVTTTRGQVIGRACDGMAVFKGIPYAAPPGPSRGANLPVLVWIHGGALKTGHGGQALFDGRRLAARGIVVVTLNMRLGALGFLSLSELANEDPLGASGNYGLQDVVSALNWVQQEIRAFGGDAARVTVAGNSAGAEIVSHLLAAPAARGLFRAAIGQSMSGVFRPQRRMMPARVAEERGATLTAPLGRSLAQLREQPATAFLRMPSAGIVIDGRIIVEDTSDVYIEGRQAAVPLLAGWNSDEGSLYATSAAANELTLQLPSNTDRAAIDEVYELGEEMSPEARRTWVGDRRFVYPVWRWVRTHGLSSGASTWLYEFDRAPPLPDDIPVSPDVLSYGAFHTAELPYVWDNLDVLNCPWREADRLIAERISDMWAKFVKYCNPCGHGFTRWHPFDALSGASLMAIGETMKSSPVKRRSAFTAIDSIYLNDQQMRA